MVHSDCGYNSLNALEQLTDSDLLIRESQDWTSIIFNGWFVNLVQMYHTIIDLRYHLKSIQLLYIISVLAENRGGLAKPKTEKTEPKNTEGDTQKTKLNRMNLVRFRSFKTEPNQNRPSL